jgi:putative redox protein
MAEKNGFNLEEFQAMVAAVQQEPDLGKLTFRASYAWKDGFAGDTQLETIEQLGQPIQRRFTLPGDHPPELLGHDYGPSSVETLMAALGSCIAGTYAKEATARGIDIDGIDIELEAKVDLNGFLQLAPVRPGPSGIRAKVRVKSGTDDVTLTELCEATKKASPVYDALTNPVPVEAWVERA